MAANTSNKFNNNALIALRQQVSMPASQVAKFTSIPTNLYALYESGQAHPSDKDLKKLARFFRTPAYTFYRSRPPAAMKRLDFRRDLSSYRGEPGPILDAVNTASQMQKLLLSVVDRSEMWSQRDEDRLSTNQDVEASALYWRKRLNIQDRAQIEIATKSSFFTLLRSRVESFGISVLVDSFPEKFLKGLVIGASSDIPVILINSFKQQKSSRTFTLAHEFAHVLLGQNDVSNPYEPDGATERFCNKFAAALLMPDELISKLLKRRSVDVQSNAGIKWLSNKLKVSMEAVVIRLQDRELVPGHFWQEWKSQFTGQIPLPSEEPEQGGSAGDEPVDQGLVKLARYGFLLAQSIAGGIEKNKLPKMAVYRASKLKPEYIPSIVRAAEQRIAEFNAYAAE